MKARHSSLEILLGAGLLLLAIFFGLQLWRDKQDLFTHNYYVVAASLDQAAGVDSGTAVKMAGLKIGQVKNRTLNKKTYRADLQLEINRAIALPKDSTLVVGAAGLLGATEVKIEPGTSSEMMANGDVFQKTTSQPSLEDMIGRAIFVLNAIGGGQSGQSDGKTKK